MNYEHLLEEVKAYISSYFGTQHDPKLVYHNLAHTQEVVKFTIQIANHYQLNEKDFFIHTNSWNKKKSIYLKMGTIEKNHILEVKK